MRAVLEPRCAKCKELKIMEDFYTDKRKKNGLYSWCKSCCALFAKGIPKIQRRKELLKYSYGMTLEEYDRRVVEQCGRCFICFDACELVVDHNHTTGQTRDLLCLRCNTALGMTRERLDVLTNMIQYLESHNGA